MVSVPTHRCNGQYECSSRRADEDSVQQLWDSAQEKSIREWCGDSESHVGRLEPPFHHWYRRSSGPWRSLGSLGLSSLDMEPAGQIL
jgi:hypothetical protein